jgi:myo-inositol-1(or 4)-monophosphatase
MSPSAVSPRQLLEVAELAARAGAAELMSWRGRFTAREKLPSDLVTEADLASQAAVSRVIGEHFPDHAFLGEENPGSLRDLLAQPICWVVDPLDGTTNYVHGFPAWCVSVAVVVEGTITAGAIYDPLADEMFAGAVGEGATLNGQPMAVSRAERIDQALLAMSLPARVAGPEAPDVRDFLRLVGSCQGIRRTGSAALNLAYVAQGRLDGHWARQISPWDVAAGVLLVELAGGQVTGCDGEPLDLANPHFVVTSSPRLQQAMLAVLAEGKDSTYGS